MLSMLLIFFASPRQFDFLSAADERFPDLVESYENEVVHKSFKEAFC